MIGSSPILTGGWPEGLNGGSPSSYGPSWRSSWEPWYNFGGWFNDTFQQPLRAPEPPEPEPETREVIEFKGQALQYVPDLGEPKSYTESRDKLIEHLRKEIDKLKFKPPKSRCDLDAGLELDREVIRRCGFPGRTSYMGEFREGRMTNQRLCVHKEGQQGIHAFSPSTDLNHAMEAAERTGVLYGRVLFNDYDAGWFFEHGDKYCGEQTACGRRGAKTAAVAICRHLVDSISAEPLDR